MQDGDILAILFGVILFGVIVFGWLPARRERQRKQRLMHSDAGASGPFDPASDCGGSSDGSDGGGGDGGGD